MKGQRRTPRRCLAAIGLIAALTAAACSPDGSTTVTTPAPTTTLVTTTIRRAPDGILRIGVLRPSFADNTDIATSLVTAVRLAVNEMNSAGSNVEMIVRDEGSDAITAKSIDELAELGVSAIIGPMSSNAAIANLSKIVQHNTLACSPTATTLALDDYPDNGLFFRTIPSDTMQAAAIARLVDRTGARSTALLYIDDGYGRPLADAVQRQLEGQSPLQRIRVDGSESSITSVVGQLIESNPGAVVVIADPKTGPALVNAVNKALVTDRVTFVVNDLLRRAFVGNPTGADVVGASIRAISSSPDFVDSLRRINATTTGAFASYAYDCAMLIGLASAQRGSTLATDIASEMVGVSVGGSVCQAYAECLALIRDGRNIDYDGVLGTADLTRDGEAMTGDFEAFHLIDGADVTIDDFVLTR